MKKEIGISVYPDLCPLDEIKQYLRLASAHGCTRVFSSMFSVEGSNEEILAYFQDFIQAAHECGMKVSLDVNPGFIKKLGANYDDLSLFHEIGCDILRLDLSFGKEKDLIACENPYGIVIQLNASMGIEEELQYLQDNGIDDTQLMLGHNFYPQRYTGLKWKAFCETNQSLKKYGYPIEAFIASKAENTHGVWDAKDGLPTVEMMRDDPADLQARLLFAAGTDHVFFGNANADECELQAAEDLLRPQRKIENSPVYEILKGFGSVFDLKEEKILRVNVCDDITDNEKFFLFDVFPHVDMGDSSEWIWRSRLGRFLNKNYPIVPKKYEQKEFMPGSVLIVNDNYKHYAGEIQIARLPMVNDGTRNFIGVLNSDEMKMLDVINDGDAVVFLSR